MAINDIYQVKVFQTYLSQNVLNVYFYRQITTGSPDNAEGLFEAVDAQILSEQMQIMNNSYDVPAMEVFQPAVPTDFFTARPTNDTGLRVVAGGDRSPAFVAFGYRSNRAGPGTRSSFKRYAGMIDQDMDGNLLNPGFTSLPQVIALQAALGADIDDGASGALYEPVQVKHPVLLNVEPTVNLDIDSWFDPYLTSQVSRRSPTGL